MESREERGICPGCGRELRSKRCLYCGAAAVDKVQYVKEGGPGIIITESVTDEKGKELSREVREKIEEALQRGEGTILEQRTLVTEHGADDVEREGRLTATKILRLLEGMKREDFDDPEGEALSRKLTVDLILEAISGMAKEEQLRFVSDKLESSAFSPYIDGEIIRKILSRLLQGEGPPGV